MTYGSTYATVGCFLTVAALGFFLFGGKDCMWCYVVGSLCLLPLVGALIYAWCVYPCKEQGDCCYAEEGCWVYCCGYPEPQPQPKPKTKRTGNPKPPASAPPQNEQMPTAPPILELRQVVIQT